MTALDAEAIQALGLARVGDDVRIDDRASFFGAGSISIGSHTRIDAGVVVTAGPAAVTIGDHVHLAAGAMVFGTAGVVLDDFANISSRVAVYSTSDDFTSGTLTGPTVDDDLKAVLEEPVYVGRHAIVGTGSVVLPGVRLGLGSSVGALSLVKRSLADGEIVAGAPARTVGWRPLERLLAGEREMRERDRRR
jgi:acetyltransferase-like isoleucine patch superfamily enzyme